MSGLLRQAASVVWIVLHGAYDTTTREGRQNERYRRIVLTAIGSAFAKAVAMAAPLITVRLALGYLGTEVFGLWMTITSLFTFFAFADFGLGSGLHMQLSRTYGIEPDEVSRRLVSSTFFMLVVIALILVGLFVVTLPVVEWEQVLGASASSAGGIAAAMLAAVFLPKLINIPFSTVRRAQLALQEGFQSSIWDVAGRIVMLAAIAVCVTAELNAVTLVLAASASLTLALIVNWLVFFYGAKREIRPTLRLVSLAQVRPLLGTGSQFAALAFLSTIALAADNVIVAHLSGLDDVAVLSVATRVAFLVSISVHMLSMPLWAAHGEAFARGEVEWVRRTTRKVVAISASIMIVGGSGLVLIGPWFVTTFLAAEVDVPRVLFVGLVLREGVTAVLSPYFMVLNGAGAIKVQVYAYLAYAIAATVIKILGVEHLGYEIVPWVGALALALIVAPPVLLMVRTIYRRGSE